MKEGVTKIAAMTSEEVSAHFTRDGRYAFARWGRPIAPVIFGLADESLTVFRDVLRAVVAHSGHQLAETDPEMGANLLCFFVRDWDELRDLPDLEALTGQSGLAERLRELDADQYRIFRYDGDGGIRACICFVRLAGVWAEAHTAVLAERLSVQAMLDFAVDVTPSAGLAQLIRAAYDPVLPHAAQDVSHALRLAARIPADG